jgi:hypothetical protein
VLTEWCCCTRFLLRRYFEQPWNRFDFLLVGLSLALRISLAVGGTGVTMAVKLILRRAARV